MKTVHKIIAVHLGVTGFITGLFYGVSSSGNDAAAAVILLTAAVLLSLAGSLCILHINRKNITEPLEHIIYITNQMKHGGIEIFPLIKGPEMRTIVQNLNYIDTLLNDRNDEIEKTVHREKKVLRTLDSISNLNRILMGKDRVLQLLEIILASGIDMIKSETGAIVLIDRLTNEVTHFMPHSSTHGDSTTIPVKGLINELIIQREPVQLLSSDNSALLRKIEENMGVKINNLLSAPITVDRELTGIFIFINSRDTDNFTIENRNNAKLICSQAAMAIEKSLLQEDMQRMAKTDKLTGLDNQRSFHERLHAEIKRAERFSRPLAVLFIDIDFLERFNHTYGRHSGNAAIREISAILSQDMRKIDTVARYSGEAFSVILPETSAEGALKAADRIKRDVGTHPFRIDDMVTYLTVSIGISIFPDDVHEKDDLISAASEAVRMAKKTGRNKIVFYSQCRRKEEGSNVEQPDNSLKKNI